METIQYLTSIYEQFMELAKANPILATGVSLWGLSAATFLLRGIPSKIVSFIFEQSTTSFTLNNAGNTINQHRYNAMLSFIATCSGMNFSRHLMLKTSISWNEEKLRENTVREEIQPGFSTHFFWWDGRLFWYSRSAIDSSATNMQKEQCRICTFGRSHAPFEKIYLAAFPEEAQTEIKIHRWNNDYWEQKASVVKRPLHTVITKDNLKEDLLENMKKFIASEEWYNERGISWKEVYVLHGPPGTGKTSLVKALASHMELSIFEIDISLMSNTSFSAALTALPQKSVCLIEDFDSATSTHSRRKIESKQNKIGNISDGSSSPDNESDARAGTFEFLTLSGILNALDGVTNLHGCMVFMSTNCIDKIDPALLRKGRTDFNYYVGYLGDKEVKEYISMVFPEFDVSGMTFDEMPGCNLYAAFKENRESVQDFIASLPKV